MVSDPRLHALSARARRIPFVALVEQLERLLAGDPVGASASPRDERLRFRHDPRLVFHPSDVAALAVGPDRVELTSTFLGALGAVSPLAGYFSEDVLRADGAEGLVLRSFYDLFHHRLLALCYRALQKGRPAHGLRRRGDDAFTGRALALTGLLGSRPGEAVAPTKLLARARVLGQRPRTRDALTAAIAVAFPALDVRVVDFFPKRVELRPGQRLRLGTRNHRLGAETRLGRSMRAQSDLLRLAIGPVDRATYDRLLPEGDEHARLLALVDELTGGMLDVELEIELRPGHEPRAALGGLRAGATRLGRGALVRASGTATAVHARLRLGEPGLPSLHASRREEPGPRPVGGESAAAPTSPSRTSPSSGTSSTT